MMGKMKDLLPESQVDLNEEPLCECGHEYESHLWNINMQPEGEPEWEQLGCHDCGEWNDYGDYFTNCENYEAI